MRRKILSPAVDPMATRSAAREFHLSILRRRGGLSVLRGLAEAAPLAQLVRHRSRRQIRKTAKASANLPCLRANRDRSAGNVQHEVLREPDLQEMRPDWLRPG